MNMFNGLQDVLLNTVNTTMGDTATWIPSAGGAAITATVLYNGPTEKEKLFDAAYNPDKITIEYKVTDLTGLEESVEANNDEVITVTPHGNFSIKSIQKKWDGKTMIANLVKIV